MSKYREFEEKVDSAYRAEMEQANAGHPSAMLYIVVGLQMLGFAFLLWLFYQHAVVKPQLAVEAANVYATERATQQANLDLCMEDAFAAYSSDWDQHCLRMGNATDCTLSMDTANFFNNQLNENQNRCALMYGFGN
jgi:hypothetical protein